MFKVGDRVRCDDTVGDDAEFVEFGVRGVVYTIEAVNADCMSFKLSGLEECVDADRFTYVPPTVTAYIPPNPLAEALNRLATVLERLEGSTPGQH